MSTVNHPTGTAARPMAAPTLDSAQLPTRVRRVLAQLHARVADELGRELEHVLDQLEAELFRQAERARNSIIQAGSFESLRALRENRLDLVPRLMARLDAALAGLRTPAGAMDAPGDPAAAPRTGQLRLVDDSQLSEEALIQAVGQRHTSRAGLQLMLLGQRFGVLAGTPAFTAEQLPVGPHALTLQLSIAADELAIDQDTRLHLFRLFDRQMLSVYPALAESMNLLLDQANVLPGLSFVPLRQRPAPQRRDTAADTAGEATPARAAPTADAPRRAATAAGSNAGAGAAMRQVFTGWPAEAARLVESAEPGDLAYLQELLLERRQLLDRIAGALPQRPRIALATAQVDAALRVLQAQRDAHGDTPRTPLQVRQQVLASGTREHGEPIALSREDSETFDLLGQLYTEIGRELREATTGAELLARLQVPLLRAALHDRGFFVRQQHPARQLLGTVAESGTHWLADGETDPQFDRQLRNAVDHVVENYDGDDQVFEAANQSLQQHLRLIARKAETAERRHVEAARGRDRLDGAKERAAQALARALGEREPPKFLRTLLEQAWTDVSTLVLLRHGEDSDAWRAHTEATAAIIAAGVDGIPAPPGLEEQVREELGLVGYQGEEAAEVARRLTSAGDESDDGASRTELVMRIKARTRLGGDEPATQPAPPPPPRNPQEQECYAHLRTLPFGTWFDFPRDDGSAARYRLAWFSPTSGRALLVNARGQRVDLPGGQAHDLDVLARMLAAGQARIVTVDSVRLIDRAWQATLGALRSLAGRGGTPAGTPPDSHNEGAA